MKHRFLSLLAGFGLLTMASCASNDDVVGHVDIAANEQTKTVEWNETEASIAFTANTNWTASVTDVTTRAANTHLDWLKLTTPSGKAGEQKMPFLMTKNDNENYREAQIIIKCGDQTSVVTIHQNANPDAVHIMDPAKIPNYDKFYCPGTWNEGFAKGPEGMLRSDAKWSWWRYKQSEHFFVFWEPGFGSDPNADSIPEALRINVDDLLQKAEQFYKTNIEKLGMVNVGQGKSILDKYKMEIFLLYQTDWLATGSGYDDKIGALWVNPTTCKPVGSTIAHEIGHSFQYQVSADKIANGEGQIEPYGANVGFRYGFGPNGSGGCAFWENCAQWQSFQDYPQEAFTQDANVQVWLKNYHRSFLHEWQRYACYWFMYYLIQKHGIKSYASLWKESKFPEDPLQTYMRLYCHNDLNVFYKDMFEYSQHCANYDFDAVHRYVTDASLNFNTLLHRNAHGRYQVAYKRCPGTTGFNLIALNIPAAGTKVTAHFKGLAPGSALAPGDDGQMVDGDGRTKGNTTTYNAQDNKAENFRYGYVAIDKSGQSHYGKMYSGTAGDATFTVPANTARLYFLVMGAPDVYHRHAWNDDESDDEQWPYEVGFTNTDLLGNVVLPGGEPESTSLTHTVHLDATSQSYVLGIFNLLNSGDMSQIAKAFRLQPSAIAAATLAAGSVPADGPANGQIAIALTQPDGSLSYKYSAVGTGFWIAANGQAAAWGNSPVYFEYNPTNFCLAYGHKPGSSVAGSSYTIKPTMVYNKGGKLYKAVITLHMKF